MALKSTIFKAELTVSDLLRHYYQTHALTIACHPSENDARMMVRLLAFALNASETLQFGRGISSDDEPDVWQKNLHGDVELWIDLGQVDEKRLRKASHLAEQVKVYTYQPAAAQQWWKQSQDKLQRLENLMVYALDDDSVAGLAQMCQRSMRLQVTLDEDACWVSDGQQTLNVVLTRWQ
ncbi:MAG: YaeQ family protein [Gammaproteobacteria bacterium]|nr:YaeQ family protein [Gammaproteobacteria bacterium]